MIFNVVAPLDPDEPPLEQAAVPAATATASEPTSSDLRSRIFVAGMVAP
jgi:hypothetical protein